MTDNVRDGRRGFIGSWTTEPLVYDELGPEHVGRTVIYRDYGRAEAGTITSWRNGVVFARYSRGDTAAGANAIDLVLGIRALDTPEDILEASKSERL
jgi:hypothetical protein